MDPIRITAEYATTTGRIGRLEDLEQRAREAYVSGDKRMFHLWIREYGPSWQGVQDSINEIGQASLREVMNGNTQYVGMHDQLTRRFVMHTNSMNAFMASINRENPAFLVASGGESSPKSGGCYVATAVYGSYDAPEVLVLRGFRDQTLAASRWGRGFIAFYYAVSPPLARRLAGAPVVNGLVRRRLDALVRRLEQRGR